MAPSAHLSNHGIKRKRSPVHTQRTKSEIIDKKLHHGINQVRKGAKKAVAFELRKLVKKLKAARQAKGNPNNDDPSELEHQLEVLKTAEHEQFANTALRTRILKDRMLSQNEDIQTLLSEKLSSNLVTPQQPGSPAAKVYGRLLSSKTLSDAVHAVVNSLREVLNPSVATARAHDTPGDQSRDDDGELGNGDDSGDRDDSSEEDEAHAIERSLKLKKPRLPADGEVQDSGEESDVADNAGWESGTVDDGEGGRWDSGTINDSNEAIQVTVSSDDTEDEGDMNEAAHAGSSEESRNPKAKAKPKPPAAKSRPTQAASAGAGESTFLPSLSVGFTRGDSDASDLSDDEANTADAPRKNRRGQRARRAIWEKKYGSGANHVKKQREAPRLHGGEGNFKRNFQGDRQDGIRNKSVAPPPRGNRQSDRASRAHNAFPAPPSGFGTGAKDSAKPLHPSWEAKKKLKEKLNPGIVPAQGKKITFS